MAFKYEVVPAEEIEKMDLDAIGGAKNVENKQIRALYIFGKYWCVDRDRDAYLFSLGSKGPGYTGTYHLLIWKGEHIRFCSKYIPFESEGKMSIQIEVPKDSMRFPEEWDSVPEKKQLEDQVLELLKEVLNVEKDSDVLNSFPLILV